jgi:Zn finger protein HypA/HybF involved in hydrogenase expression
MIAELEAGNRQLLHCLDCGRQVVARRHGGSCMLCGSDAIVIETV